MQKLVRHAHHMTLTLACSDFYTRVDTLSTLDCKCAPVWIKGVRSQTHLLVLLEGGLELQVVPGGQDEAKSGLVRPKTTLAGLQVHMIVV